MFFGRLRIQTKLALLVLVPLLGVVGLAVPIVLSRIDAATEAQRTADSVALADRIGSMLQELQQERLLSVGYLLGVVDRARLELQSAEVVDWVTGVSEERRGALPVSMLGPLSSARALDTTRAAVLDRKLRADQVINEFATVITPIIDAIGLRRQADLTTSTGRQVLALDSVLRADEGISQTMSLLAVAVASDNPSQIITVSQKYTVLQAEADRFRNFGTPEQVLLYEDVQKSFTARAGNNFLETLTLDPAVAGRSLSVPTLFPSVESVSALGRFIEKKITADVTAAAADSRSRATTTAYVVAALTLLLVVLVVALSLAVAQAVARPLRRLTTSADRIARTAEDELQRVADDEAEATRPVRLDSVDVQARDEIGDLARAFERVQGTAARLVERQVASRRNVAQMFGHVGRRTQNLVGRQLALIDRLERQETDSSRLRELYRLDHVSSRLRRNASSLVVLSGGTGADDY
ncbi:MAG TPA: nitrate- and nitrite sensing domain-containing protein, partial [Catenuloplanes sp.]